MREGSGKEKKGRRDKRILKVRKVEKGRMEKSLRKIRRERDKIK